MSKSKMIILGMLVIVMVTGFILAGCEGNSPTDTPPVIPPPGSETELTVSAGEFSETLQSISATPGEYIINLSGNLSDYEGISLTKEGVKITVKGTGSNEISWKQASGGPSSLFHVNGASLVLENIKLSRSADNTSGGELLSVDGGTLEIKSGVIISNNIAETEYYDGIKIIGGVFTMTDGTIQDCKNGVIVDGNGTSVTISKAIVRNNTEIGLNLVGTNCNLIVSDTTFTGNGSSGKDDINFTSVNLGGTENHCIISGGIISGTVNDNGLNISGTKNSVIITGMESRLNRYNGIITGSLSANCNVIINNSIFKNNLSFGFRITGSGHSILVSGGEFSENAASGIFTRSESSNNNLIVNNATIKNNNDNGIYIDGINNSVTVTSVTINDNKNTGIGVGGTDNTVAMTGGTISGSKNYDGINIGGTNNSVTMTGGTISGNNHNGIVLHNSSNNCSFTMSGGTISGNESYGVLLWYSAGGSFKKGSGGVIMGNNTGDDLNKEGAVIICCDDGGPIRYSTVPNGEILEAAIKADGTLGATLGTWGY